MKPTLLLAAILSLLLAIPASADMGVETVSRARAKELGIELRVKPAGPDAVGIELSFDKAALKNFVDVSLEIQGADGKLLVSSPLKELTHPSGRITVGLTLAPSALDRTRLRIVTGVIMNYTCHDLKLKDFAEAQNAR